jgi:glyoxylase-like metal-dependent hydrolase (beta-lactamase superfamily II)
LAIVLGLVGLGVLGIAMLLTWAHHGIRLERGPLPTAGDVEAAASGEADRPVRLSVIETARQHMPRSAVLDPARDATPDAPYAMTHPSFVLEWADGRILLVDTGMPPEEAASFGKPLEWMAGAAPMEPIGALATQLGGDRERVAGVVFTHLHSDHVGGLAGLCAGRTKPLPVFMTEAQSERPNHTDRGGRRAIDEAGCARGTVVAGEALRPVPGFPGVLIVPAAGHTPGSEIVLVMLADGRGWALLGDIANAVDGVLHDVPKPPLYSLLIVPEDGVRLGELRRWLAALNDEQHLGLLPAHDGLHLRASGVPAYADVRGTPPAAAPPGQPPAKRGGPAAER